MSETAVPVPPSPVPPAAAAPPPAPLPSPARPRRLGRIVRGALLFVLGIVFGVGLTAAAIRHKVKEVLSRPETVPQWITERLDRRLHFAPAQREAVLKIVREKQEETRRARLAGMAEIEALLTPEQKRIWSELLKRFPVQ